MKKIIVITTLVFSVTLFGQKQSITIISTTSTKNNITLRKNASFFSKSSNKIIKKGVKIDVIDFKNNYWLIKKDTIQGWCSSDFIFKTSKMYDVINEFKHNKNIQEFGVIDGKRVSNGEIWIGMTKEMLLSSKGEPIKKNITKNKTINYEQWIYKTSYIYLEDNILKTIQSR